MKKTFDEIFECLLIHEGGYVNDPVDRGGETNMGISKRAYPGEDIKGMTKQKAKEIYFEDYWSKARVESLPDQLKYPHFDAAVNMGVRAAAKILQRSIGVEDDGIIGPITLKRARNAHLYANVNYSQERLKYYVKIVKNRPANIKFINGWTNRVMEVLLKSLP